MENGLCPGDLLLPEPPAPADAPGAGAGSGAGAGACGDFALVGLTLGLLAAGAGPGLLVFDGELTGLLDVGVGLLVFDVELTGLLETGVGLLVFDVKLIGLLVTGVGLLVFDAELIGLLDLGGGGSDREPKRSPARRRSERSSRGLIGVDDGDAAFTSAEAHLWVSGCLCVAQNCFRQSYIDNNIT